MTTSTYSKKSSAPPLTPSHEQCSICLEDLTSQEVGIPEHCQHAFCFTCISEWTQHKNTCPHDRQTIQYILRKQFYSSRQPYAKMNIEDGKLEAYVEENMTYCEECGDSEDEYALVTCTKCKSSYHSFCLNASDTKVWICPSCGWTHGKVPTVRKESCQTPLMIKRAKRPIKTSVQQDADSTRPCRRSQQSVSANVAQRFENPSIASRPSIAIHNETHPRSALLKSQTRYMAALKSKRKRLTYLPPSLPVKQMPRIQRRNDAPSRPQLTIPESKRLTNVSFMDKLLHAQTNLHSLGHVRMQGANIQLS